MTELKWHEMLLGALIGAVRNIVAVKRHSQPAHGIIPADNWRANIEGALGELAFAKATKLYPGFTLDGYEDPDVGPYQVRTTSCDNGNLIVRPGDNDHDVFVLVVGHDGNYELRGWLTGAEAKRVGKLTDRGNGRPPAHFVPQEKLHPIEELTDDTNTHAARRASISARR